MKKLISYLCIAMTLLMASCSNDDVPVTKTTSFKLNLSSVVSQFTNEFSTGDLQGIPESYRIRTRLLIYDNNGELTYSNTQFFTNYSSVMTDIPTLEAGDYTVLALSDVVRLSDGDAVDFEYWAMSGEENLTTCRLTNTGYIGYQREIIGYASSKVTIGEYNTGDISLDLRPAGAIYCILRKNIHTFYDVTRLDLATNRSADFLQFDSNGNYDLVVENDNNKFNWRVATLDIPEQTADNIYSYCFVLPFTNVSYKWEFFVNENEYLAPMSTMSVARVEPGHQYYFEVDFNNEDGLISQTFFELSTRSSEMETPADLLPAQVSDPKVLEIKNLVK